MTPHHSVCLINDLNDNTSANSVTHLTIPRPLAETDSNCTTDYSNRTRDSEFLAQDQKL